MHKTRKCRHWHACRRAKAFKRAKLFAKKLRHWTMSNTISRFGFFKKPELTPKATVAEQPHHSG